jgi:hypothetical protein
MEPHRRSIVRQLIWASTALLGVVIVARVVWVIEANRRIQEQREMVLRLQRAETELHLAWLAAEEERQRAERAIRRLRHGGRDDSWLCERVPCTDFPLTRPEDRIPRLLRASALVGDGPRRPERW